MDRTLATQEFGEAGINLTAAGVIPADSCVSFGKAYAVSRSSGNSAQAQMKDLVGPANFNLNNCGTIKIIKRTDPRGLNQNFSYTSNIAGKRVHHRHDAGELHAERRRGQDNRRRWQHRELHERAGGDLHGHRRG